MYKLQSTNPKQNQKQIMHERCFDWKKNPLEVFKTGMRMKDFNFPGKICRTLNEAGGRGRGGTNLPHGVLCP